MSLSFFLGLPKPPDRLSRRLANPSRASPRVIRKTRRRAIFFGESYSDML
jgi:hypothetical protein